MTKVRCIECRWEIDIRYMDEGVDGAMRCSSANACGKRQRQGREGDAMQRDARMVAAMSPEALPEVFDSIVSAVYPEADARAEDTAPEESTTANDVTCYVRKHKRGPRETGRVTPWDVVCSECGVVATRNSKRSAVSVKFWHLTEKHAELLQGLVQ